MVLPSSRRNKSSDHSVSHGPVLSLRHSTRQKKTIFSKFVPDTLSPKVTPRRSSRGNESISEQSECSVSPVPRPKDTLSPKVIPRRSSRGKESRSEQSESSVSPVPRPKDTLSPKVIPRRSSRRIESSEQSDRSVSPVPRPKGTISPKVTPRRSSRRNESDRTASPGSVLSPRHSTRPKGTISPKVMPGRSRPEQSDSSASPIHSPRQGREKAFHGSLFSPSLKQAKAIPVLSHMIPYPRASASRTDAIEPWTSDEDGVARESGSVESSDIEGSKEVAEPSSTYGQRSNPRERGVDEEGTLSPHGKEKYCATPALGIARKVRRSHSNERFVKETATVEAPVMWTPL